MPRKGVSSQKVDHDAVKLEEQGANGWKPVSSAGKKTKSPPKPHTQGGSEMTGKNDDSKPAENQASMPSPRRGDGTSPTPKAPRGPQRGTPAEETVKSPTKVLVNSPPVIKPDPVGSSKIPPPTIVKIPSPESSPDSTDHNYIHGNTPDTNHV